MRGTEKSKTHKIINNRRKRKNDRNANEKADALLKGSV